MPVSRVLVIDEHLMLAEALSERLSAVPDLWIVGQCSARDPRLPRLVGEACPDVVALDVEPLGSAAGNLVRWVRAKRAAAHVVVLTGAQDPRLAVEAARAGAAAWVPKTRGVDELTTVLRGVCAGRAFYPSDLLGPVLRALREDVRRAAERNGPLEVLSDRERDVLLGMVAGKRGAEIAEELLISAETVRTHTRSILSKLRVHSQLEAVSVARTAGLVPAQDPDAFPAGW